MVKKKNSKIYRLKNSNIDEVAGRVAEVLLAGGICIIPTDTVYGIVALDKYTKSVREIIRIKNRPANKKFLRLIGTFTALKRYTPQNVPEELRKYWPGPLTIIFRTYEDNTVAIRWPDHYFLNALFRIIGNEGMVAPSANISGNPPLFDEEELVQVFSRQVDLIVVSEDMKPGKKPSTIIDITEKPWKIIREGELKIRL